MPEPGLLNHEGHEDYEGHEEHEGHEGHEAEEAAGLGELFPRENGGRGRRLPDEILFCPDPTDLQRGRRRGTESLPRGPHQTAQLPTVRVAVGGERVRER